MGGSSPALAQALTADGTTQNAAGTYATTAASTAGYGFNVINNGRVNSTGAITITTSGSTAYGVNVASGGVVNLTHQTSIQTTGESATGLVVNGGTFMATAPVSIIASGRNPGGFNFSTAVLISNGGAVTLNGGTVQSNYSTALDVRGVGSSFTGTNLTIDSLGGQGPIDATSGARVTLTGGSISGLSNDNTINASGANSVISLTGLSVTTKNETIQGVFGTAAAVVSTNLGHVNVDNVTITTYTNSGEGVASTYGGTALVTNTNITTYGSNAVPGDAGAGSTGLRAYGVYASDPTRHHHRTERHNRHPRSRQFWR